MLTADGPSIVGHHVRVGEYGGGVALVVLGLRRFVPSEFGRSPRPWDWYIVKYRSEARVHLDGFAAEHVRRMRVEFGRLLIDEQDRPDNPAQAFYSSQAWSAWCNALGNTRV